MQEAKSKDSKKKWFWASVIINLGFLGVFKYYNFFAESLAISCKSIGIIVQPFLLNIILPVGISFYTFHGLSYVIDIYKNKINAERNFIDYSLFVSYFPLLVAGPIERATHLLPQLKTKRTFNYENAANACKQILWGLVKKVIIADQCAIYANKIFNNYGDYSGSTLLLGAVLFSFQIYGDFSGYSDIALGTSRLFGIELLKNFSYPYFSRDIAEFWRRWHISLSSWFKDYLYFPLGGSKKGLKRAVLNTFIIFLVSGFWHGANFTFIAWGFLNALFIMPSIVWKSNRKNIDIIAQGKWIPSFVDFFKMLFTFILTSLIWVFFRSKSIKDSFSYIYSIFDMSLFEIPTVSPLEILILIVLFILIEWLGREQDFAILKLANRFNKAIRWSFYYICILGVLHYANSNHQFIYFQF